MNKLEVIDFVLKESVINKESGIMDFAKNLASKLGIKIPSKDEVLRKIKEYLDKDPRSVEEAIKLYNSTFVNKKSSLLWSEGSPRPVKIIMLLLLLVNIYLWGPRLIAMSIVELSRVVNKELVDYKSNTYYSDALKQKQIVEQNK